MSDCWKCSLQCLQGNLFTICFEELPEYVSALTTNSMQTIYCWQSRSWNSDFLILCWRGRLIFVQLIRGKVLSQYCLFHEFWRSHYLSQMLPYLNISHSQCSDLMLFTVFSCMTTQHPSPPISSWRIFRVLGRQAFMVASVMDTPLSLDLTGNWEQVKWTWEFSLVLIKIAVPGYRCLQSGVR